MIKNGPFEEVWAFPCDASVISVAVTPNCSLISAATVGCSLYLLDDQGNLTWKNKEPLDNEGWSTAISADGHFVAVGTANKKPADGSIHVFDREGNLVWTHRVRSPVWGLSFSADGKTLAAACWNDNLYLCRKEGSSYSVRKVNLKEQSVGGGLYGVKLSSNGQVCVVAAYDHGLFVLDEGGTLLHSIKSKEGFYNIAICQHASKVIAGVRAGGFIIADLDNADSLKNSMRVSQRPICGIAASADGQLVASGSFDGRVVLSTQSGDTLWDLETKGEIWSTSMSDDGAIVVVGGGDHTVRLIRNYCHCSALHEIQAAEGSVFADIAHINIENIKRLSQLYLKHGLVQYGYRKLISLVNACPEMPGLRNQLKAFLKDDLAAFPLHYQSHFELGSLLLGELKYIDAARHFQAAAENPALRSVALRRASECFSECGMPAASSSASRQSREQRLDSHSRQILFNLARSYEDQGKWSEASGVYELIVSWDATFRNAFEKWDRLTKLAPGALPERQAARKDYTGNTTSLMGPDAPRDVDPSLEPVLIARTKEVLITSDHLRDVEGFVAELLKDETFSRGVTRKLDYTQELFLKYEFGLPEDEMKKFLETVNALPFIKEQRTTDQAASLDIGSATGRYPTLLQRNYGFRAYGIDVASTAIEFSKKNKVINGWPHFVCGDARDLIKFFPDQRFNVITCMMGTFDHFQKDEQLGILRNILDRLQPGGVVIISLWDVECQHLAYLSMYNETDKEAIRKNSPTQAEMKQKLSDAGFDEVTIHPFCMLPQVVIYDLGIERMQAADIQLAAHADLAARALFATRHGEMYLAVGKRPLQA